MRGNKLAKMDDRGRLKIPRDFLKELREAYGPAVYVTSITGQSAWVYPLPVWEAIESRLRDLPSTFKGRQKYLSRTSYFGNEASIDAQGRLLIHPLLRTSAGLEGELSVLGQGDYLEVWSMSALERRIDSQGDLTEEEYDALAEAGI
jgi:MraZ protein